MKPALALVLLLVGLACAADYHGDEWQEKSAEEKLDALWGEVTKDTTPANFPSSIELGVLFLESMGTSFDTAADDFPYQGPFDLVRRKKVIHSVGSIAKAKWISVGSHPYTGVFTGADHMLVRFSSAKEVTPNENITPGISLKFLRDGVKSANLMAMPSLMGQQSMNFFVHDFTNHVPSLNNPPVAFKLMIKTFEKASKWFSMLGVSDMATYDQSGNEAATPVFPFRLVFSPNPTVTAMFPDTGDGNYVEYTQQLKEGTVLFDVYAEDEPDENNLHYEKAMPVKIGQIVLTSSPTSTNYGDNILFFQHQRMDDDFAIHPEWVDHATAISDAQAATEGGFSYPDLHASDK